MSLQFEYDAIDPNTVTGIDFNSYDPSKPESFVKKLESTASIRSGVISALNPDHVVEQLNSRGLVPVRIALITGEREGMIRLAKMKENRDKLMGIGAQRMAPIPIKKSKNLLSPQVLPYIIVIILAILGLISWFQQ